MHGPLGVAAIVALVAFAFGRRTAQIIVGAVLVLCVLAFAGVSALIIAGSI